MALDNENITGGEEQAPIWNTADLGSQIDQTTNPGLAQDLATIQQAKAPYTPAPTEQFTPVTAVSPTNQALMPGLSQPINVGTSTGQIIGSHGVYVPSGQVAPWGTFMQQQKQMQEAQKQLDIQESKKAIAADKAEKDAAKAFQFERPKIASLKDPAFQKSVNETYNTTVNSYVDQAKQIYGKDWQVALKSDTRLGREFKQVMDGLEVLTKNADIMTDKFAAIQEDIKTGDKYYSDEVKKAFRNYEQMMDEFEDGDFRALGNMREVLKNIDGHIELNTFLNKKGILSNVVAQVTGSSGAVKSVGEFYEMRTSDRKNYDKNINAMIKSIRKSLGGDYPYTDQDIRNALEGHFQNQSKSTKKIYNKPKDSLKMSKEDIIFQEGEKEVMTQKVDEQGNKLGTQRFNSVLTVPLPQPKKALKIEGIKEFGADGVSRSLANVKDVKPVSAQLVEHTLPNGQIVWKPVIVSEISREVDELDADNEPTGRKKTISETILMDAGESEDQMRLNYGDDFYDSFSGRATQVQSDRQKMYKGGSTNAPNLGKTYTEADIEATMKANPGASREDVIAAFENQ